MTARDFCYWLMGCLELGGGEGGLSASQVESVREHLALVFAHDIDPKAGGPDVQKKLNEIHHGPTCNKDTVMRC
jgi:hypothetical protein